MLKDSGIYYEPAPINSPLAPSFVQQLFHTSRLERNQNPTVNNVNLRKSYMIDSSAKEDKSPEPPLTTPYKFKRGDNNNKDHLEVEEIDNPLHLYFDLEVKPENYNSTRLEQLKNMFVKFQEAERGLSECINFHIYIFSKYKDNINKTNTNWGQVDNLSRSQELTEIQNKCDQSASIIRQSIFQVQQSYPQKQNSSEIIHEDANSIESRTGPGNLFRQVTTEPNSNRNYPGSTKNVEDDQIDYNNRKSPNFVSWLTTNAPVVTNAFGINEKDSSKATTSVNMMDENMPRRTILPEGEIEITKIITKELSNGSVTSVADGYEVLPNSDFITNNIISAEENTETTLRTDHHNDLVEIKGHLYFLFGDKPIPARFMQQPGGEINVAMDGFSLCTQMLQTNQSTFMNLLCNCIQQKKCSFS